MTYFALHINAGKCPIIAVLIFKKTNKELSWCSGLVCEVFVDIVRMRIIKKGKHRNEDWEDALDVEAGVSNNKGVEDDSGCNFEASVSVEHTIAEEGKSLGALQILWRVLVVLLLLFLFVCSLDLLGSAFKLMGGEAAGKVFSQNKVVSNPVAGLMIGVLVTVLLQSSSTSSSLVVAMVASSFITVETAVPIIMGANIGTSVTNTIVALSQIQNGEMFKRSFSAATIHDMFNILTVLILLPIEWMFHMLKFVSGEIVDKLALRTNENAKVELLSVLTDPITNRVVMINKTYLAEISKGHLVGKDEQLLQFFCDEEDHVNGTSINEMEMKRCKALFSQFDLSDKVAGLVILIFSLALMFCVLVLMVKILKSIFQGHISKVINKTVNAGFPGKFNFLTGYVAILVGVVMTVLVQSSSIFTSTLTPLVGLNVISLERAFPLTLGSNIGTTVTSMLAAMASDSNFDLALQISLCHLLFNVIGILVWYPIPRMREIPLMCARQLGKTTEKYRWFAFAYIVFIFVVAPVTIFCLSLAGTEFVIAFCSMICLIALSIGLLKLLQNCCPQCLPRTLRTFEFLPRWLRSLEPFHNTMCGMLGKVKSGATFERVRRTTESFEGCIRDENPNNDRESYDITGQEDDDVKSNKIENGKRCHNLNKQLKATEEHTSSCELDKKYVSLDVLDEDHKLAIVTAIEAKESFDPSRFAQHSNGSSSASSCGNSLKYVKTYETTT